MMRTICFVLAICIAAGGCAASVLLVKDDVPGDVSQTLDESGHQVLAPIETPDEGQAKSTGGSTTGGQDDSSGLTTIVEQMQASGKFEPAEIDQLQQDLKKVPANLRPLLEQTILARQARQAKSPAAGKEPKLASDEPVLASPPTDEPPTPPIPMSKRDTEEQSPVLVPTAALAQRSEPRPVKSSEPTLLQPANKESETASRDAPEPSPRPEQSPPLSELAELVLANESTSASSQDIQKESPRPGQWKKSLAQAIDDLKSEMNHGFFHWPGDGDSSGSFDDASDQDAVRQELLLRLLYLAGGHQQDAAAKIEQLSTAEQEYFKHQLLALWIYLDPDGNPDESRRKAAVLRQLRDAMGQLTAATSTLEVRNLAFCRKVFSYGQFEPFNEYKFEPGQEVLLYVEIDNFMSQETSGKFETTIGGSYRIFDQAGHSWSDHTFPVERELCRNRRRDFFIPYRMWIPDKIPAGNYRLEITMEDTNAEKFGQSSIDFSVIKGR